MRSATIFIVFGIILVGFVLLVSLSNRSVANSPVMQTAKQFMTALQNSDAAAAETLLDASTAKLLRAGNQITAIQFSAVSPIEGAFARRPAITWNYLKLSQLTIDQTTEPVVAENAGVATVECTGGVKLVLKEIDTQWKVIYIAESSGESMQ